MHFNQTLTIINGDQKKHEAKCTELNWEAVKKMGAVIIKKEDLYVNISSGEQPAAQMAESLSLQLCLLSEEYFPSFPSYTPTHRNTSVHVATSCTKTLMKVVTSKCDGGRLAPPKKSSLVGYPQPGDDTLDLNTIDKKMYV